MTIVKLQAISNHVLMQPRGTGQADPVLVHWFFKTLHWPSHSHVALFFNARSLFQKTASCCFAGKHKKLTSKCPSNANDRFLFIEEKDVYGNSLGEKI
jgi:hypothetical protein